MKKIMNNSVHLCNSCCNNYPDCDADENSIFFGDGIGEENICCCNRYVPLMEYDSIRKDFVYNKSF